jgi:hypothetical protein
LAVMLWACPNPIRNQTTIFSVGAELPVSPLAIFDVSGRVVRVLDEQGVPDGSARWHWNRRNAAGRPVVPGSYFAVLKTGNHKQTIRLIVTE